MNISSKPRFPHENALPLSQDGVCAQRTNLSSLNPSSSGWDVKKPSEPFNDAAEIYGGVASSFVVPETSVNSLQDNNTTTIADRPYANTASWSTSLQTVLDQPPSTLPHKLILGGMVFCLAFGAWAWLGQIEQVGHAQGWLVPKGEVYKIDPVDSGKVARIAITEGEEVKAGQVLVEMDTELALGEVSRISQMLAADKIQLSQKQAMIDRTLLQAQTRAAITKAESQAQEAAIAESTSKAATTRQLLTQLRADEAAFKARRERLKPYVEQGALAKEQLFEAEQALRDRTRAITTSVGNLQQALAQANQLKAGLIQKLASGRTTQLETIQLLGQQKVEMTQLKGKIDETQNLLHSASAKLKQRFLYAPVDGYVSSLNIRNIGQVVQPGQTVAEVAADNAPLVLLASLPNQEAGFVKTGMPVKVKLDAYPYQDYGIVPGKVISISPDSKRDERLGSVYRVEVALERNSITAKHQTIKFKPGQTASADIIIRRRRIADILLEPFRQLQKGGIDL